MVPKILSWVSQYILMSVESFTDRKPRLGKAAVLRFRKYALKSYGFHRNLSYALGEFEDGIETG